MKTLRKSRSFDNRNTRMDVIARGSPTPLVASIRHERIMSNRRLRYIACRTSVGTAQLDLIVRGEDGVFTSPTVTVLMDDRTRRILGHRTS
jgi:hypothetical protein